MKRRLLAAGLLAAAVLPAAADQALLLTIADYVGGVPSLPGVQRDRESARRIAQALGFAEGTITEARDGALDLEGLQRQFAALVERTQPGERVFVYFSGHGTSRSAGDRCEQALLAQDGRALPASAVARQLGALGAKAGEVVMLVDACFSGGLAAAASLRGAGDALRPKFARSEGSADHCEQPANFVPALTRSLRGAVNLERNQVVLAAAREDELAFDHSQHGGLATAAMAECLGGAVVPSTMAELVACAQGGVERRLPADPRLRTQHVTLGGAGEMRIAAAAGTPAAASRLQALLAQADPGWGVQLAASAATLRIGRDDLALTVTSTRAGYLTLLSAGSDGRTLGLLYPGQRDTLRQVAAGAPFLVPKRWRARGPAGTNRIVAVVSETPLTTAELMSARGYGAAALVVEEAE